ncbi:unnamed protein product [Rotaria sp. Silwood2]|nr:unnamed protein product [Rotaria sp. Silwood2]CAF4479808.1 unnamed protein product [Rotaria sp. Silwood2]
MRNDFNRGTAQIKSITFDTFCNYTEEYGCILANVNDPLNFAINRQCINLTQIGDGVINCYGGLDERNILTCGNNLYEQHGFNFHCNDQECMLYHLLCQQRCANNADSLFYDQLRVVLELILRILYTQYPLLNI